MDGKCTHEVAQNNQLLAKWKLKPQEIPPYNYWKSDHTKNWRQWRLGNHRSSRRRKLEDPYKIWDILLLSFLVNMTYTQKSSSFR